MRVKTYERAGDPVSQQMTDSVPEQAQRSSNVHLYGFQGETELLRYLTVPEPSSPAKREDLTTPRRELGDDVFDRRREVTGDHGPVG